MTPLLNKHTLGLAELAPKEESRFTLEQLCKFARRAHGKRGNASVVLYFESSSRAVMLKAKTDAEQDITMLLMPKQSDDVEAFYEAKKGREGK